MARYIITGTKSPCPISFYISKKGLITSDAIRAYVTTSLEDAKQELEYHSRTTAGYSWSIERLPPRKSLSRAVLFAVAVEV